MVNNIMAYTEREDKTKPSVKYYNSGLRTTVLFNNELLDFFHSLNQISPCLRQMAACSVTFGLNVFQK